MNVYWIVTLGERRWNNIQNVNPIKSSIAIKKKRYFHFSFHNFITVIFLNLVVEITNKFRCNMSSIYDFIIYISS